jgi:formiminoglutamase
MIPFNVTQGDSPVILAQPHGGTFVPDEIKARLNKTGLGLADTDWHITRLYDGLLPGATVVAANFHRYVIDANRDPEGRSLYPGQNTTTLCPTTDFDGKPIYKPGEEPDAEEIEARRIAWHKPYHKALAEEVARVHDKHGVAIVYDCHSIRSDIPFLFEGTLPVFNIGTNLGATCDPRVEAAVADVCAAAPDTDMVINGRFKGGWTTRHYGCRPRNIHAIQMELAQRAYMEESPDWAYRPDRADRVRPVLAAALEALKALALSGQLTGHKD